MFVSAISACGITHREDISICTKVTYIVLEMSAFLTFTSDEIKMSVRTKRLLLTRVNSEFKALCGDTEQFLVPELQNCAGSN